MNFNGQACRSRWWPAPILPDLPAARDIAELIAVGIYERREFLVTSDLAAFIAAEWKTGAADGSAGKWTAEAFRHFLRLFPRYHFSLRHARRFAGQGRAGASSESEAAYAFEEAVEDSADLAFGPAVALGQEESAKPEYKNQLKSLMKFVGGYLGFVSPDVLVEKGLLGPGEFQIRLNDVHLPVLRKLRPGEIVLKAVQSDATKLGIETRLLFDPLNGWSVLSAQDTPEIRSKLSVWPYPPENYLNTPLNLAIVANAGSLIVSPVVHLLIENLTKSAASLVESARARFGESPPFYRRLTAILRRLLDEQVPILDLAGILENLLSLRDVSRGGSRRCVYHFSELRDSPILIARDKSINELSVGDFVAAARLGVRSLTVRTQEKGRPALPILPVPAAVETAFSTPCEGGIPRDQRTRIVELLDMQPPGDVALVVSQELRACIRARLRFELPTVPVLGRSEIPTSTLAEAWRLAGETLISRKRLDEALEMFTGAAAIQPEESIHHYDLGRTYYELDRAEKGRTEYQLAVEGSDPAWRAQIAEAFLARGSFKLAIEAYGKAIDLAPNNPVYHANLASALWSQGDYSTDSRTKAELYSEAVEENSKAIALNRDAAPAHKGAMWPLVRLGRLEEATQELREAIRLDPADVESRLEIARCLSRQGKFDEAAGELERGAAAFPSIPEIQTELAKAYAQAGQYAQAVSVAGRMRKDLLATMQKAMETAEKIALEPKAGELATLGQIQDQLGNLQAASALYRRAAAIEADNPVYHRLLGKALYKEEKWQDAASEWEKTLQLTSEDASTVSDLGTVYDKLERSGDAMHCYEKASALAPGNFVCHYNLGSSHYRLGNMEDARNAFQKAVELNDKFAPSHFNLGNCYFRLNDSAKAMIEWRAAISLDPKLMEAHFNLGVALWLAGGEENRKNALNCWREALRLDHNLTAAEDNLLAAAEPSATVPELAIFDLVHSR